MSLAYRALGLLVVLALFPFVSHAQEVATTPQMRAAVMAQLLQDPRSTDLSPEQLQALVDVLSQKAQDQQVSVEDILWHPQSFQGTATPLDADQFNRTLCASGFSTICPISEGFGFADVDPTLPLYFLVTSGLLILIIARMRKHHDAIYAAPTSTSSASSSPNQPPPTAGTYV